MLLVEKFREGGWVTVVIIGAIVALCLAIRHALRRDQGADAASRRIFAQRRSARVSHAAGSIPTRRPRYSSSGRARGGGLHALLWVQRMFPDHFKNFIFVNARAVDSQQLRRRASRWQR